MEGAPEEHISKRAKLAIHPAMPSELADPIRVVTFKDDVSSSRVDLFCGCKQYLSENHLVASALLLTARPQDPRVWQFRLSEVEKSSINWEKELELVDQLAKDNANNYLMWHYRQCVAKKIGTAAQPKEREFSEKILSKDPINDLAWSHREWVLGELGGKLTDELDYCRKMIEEDPFNVFAWNQRWTLIVKYCPEGDINTMKTMEVNRAFYAIECYPENEFTWAYLRRLFKNGMMLLLQQAGMVERVLLKIVNEAKPLSGGAGVDVLNLNRRGCFHALKLFLELMNHGYKPTRVVKDAIKVLYPVSGGLGLGYKDKMCAIVASLDLVE